MPMTREQWLGWSPTKREFFAKLFTAVILADDGMLRIDEVERRKLLTEQLEKQKAPGAEQILQLSSSANYIITNALQADGETLKAKDAEIRTLSSLRGDYDSLVRRFNGEETSEPIQYSLVGGFRSASDIPVLTHFKQVVEAKMLGRRLGQDRVPVTIKYAETRLADPRFLSLGSIHDLTFPTRCSLLPEEMEFLLDDEIFRGKIRERATQIQKAQGKLTEAVLEKAIIDYIRVCSTIKSNQKSLSEISIPCVDTYLAMYTDAMFAAFSERAGVFSRVPLDESKKPATGFFGTEESLDKLLAEGALNFTFPPEYRNLLKALVILKGPFAGQKVADIEAATEKYTIQGGLPPEIQDMFKQIITRQIENLKAGTVPPPPANMGTRWDMRRTPEKLFAIFQNQSMDLYVLASMAGFSRDQAHLAYGLGSREALQSIARDYKDILERNKQEMLAAFKKVMITLSAQYGGDPRQVQEDIQPSGLNLHCVPQLPAVKLAAPREDGLFGRAAANAAAATAAPPKAEGVAPTTARERVYAAAMARQQQQNAHSALVLAAEADKRRAEQLAAMAQEVVIDDGDEDEDEERNRMMNM